MITYEQAEEIAFAQTDGMSVCDEYEKAYRFFNPEDDKEGGSGDIVILKENGQPLTFTQFILNYHPEKTPKRKTLTVTKCGGITVYTPKLPQKLILDGDFDPPYKAVTE